MSDTIYNPQAFPSKEIDHVESGAQQRTVYHDQERGMTLRDYLATHINPDIQFNNLDQLCLFLDIEGKLGCTDKELLELGMQANAKLRYMQADAMLKARSTNPKES